MVDGVYPFYGKLELRPARPLHELLTPGTAVVASELLAHLGLKVGDSLQIGGQPFRDRRQSCSPSPTGSASRSPSAPRVFLSGAGFARTPLEARGAASATGRWSSCPDGHLERARSTPPPSG